MGLGWELPPWRCGAAASAGLRRRGGAGGDRGAAEGRSVRPEGGAGGGARGSARALSRKPERPPLPPQVPLCMSPGVTAASSPGGENECHAGFPVSQKLVCSLLWVVGARAQEGEGRGDTLGRGRAGIAGPASASCSPAPGPLGPVAAPQSHCGKLNYINVEYTILKERQQVLQTLSISKLATVYCRLCAGHYVRNGVCAAETLHGPEPPPGSPDCAPVTTVGAFAPRPSGAVAPPPARPAERKVRVGRTQGLPSGPRGGL